MKPLLQSTLLLQRGTQSLVLRLVLVLSCQVTVWGTIEAESARTLRAVEQNATYGGRAPVALPATVPLSANSTLSHSEGLLFIYTVPAYWASEAA